MLSMMKKLGRATRNPASKAGPYSLKRTLVLFGPRPAGTGTSEAA
jgi:hypothetical protein